jgi:hypothetical protein
MRTSPIWNENAKKQEPFTAEGAERTEKIRINEIRRSLLGVFGDLGGKSFLF